MAFPARAQAEPLHARRGADRAGLVANFRLSSRSYDVFLPLHRRVYEAIRDRRAADARAAMEQLLRDTPAFLEQELG